ncbi:DUF5941 domain-containing protein [Micromonospora sp. LOL_023]|uniref:DUF5941 domain-containing protein n=1 Tax=Micromonospora sp. LOL_023 TaxID=3345418 RepID=UPI003A8B2999
MAILRSALGCSRHAETEAHDVTLAILAPRLPGFSTSPGELRTSGGASLTSRLQAQLATATAAEAQVTDLRGLAALAERSDQPILLCAADVVAHTEVFRLLDAGPPVSTRALLLPPGQTDSVGATRPTTRRGRLVAVPADGGDPAGRTDGSGSAFGGVLRVGVTDLPALAVAARRVADRAHAAGCHPLDDVLDELVAGGATVAAYPLRELVARRVADQTELVEAETEVRAVDPDRARLRLAVKEHDDLFATYCVSSWSPKVTKLAAGLGLSPTGVTAISVAVAAAAAALFAVGDRPLLLLGGVLLYLGFVLDCVDGQLARYTGRFSAFGGWLDTIADRGKEYLVYAGLGIGAELAGHGDGWLLATGAIMLQTVRHMTDAWYGALHDEAVRQVPAATDTSAPAGVGSRLSQVSDRVLAAPGSPIYWAKRTIVFPIGERWALIAVTAALFGPRISLLAVLGWGVLAAGYTLALRTLRARSMRVPVLAAVDTARYRDDSSSVRRFTRRPAVGPAPAATPAAAVPAAAGQLPIVLAAVAAAAVLLLLAGTGLSPASGAASLLVGGGAVLLAGIASAVRPASGALDWLVPAGLRAAELLIVVAAGTAAEVPPAIIYGLLLVVALHHYDLTARLEKRLGAPALHRWSLGWDGRLLLVVTATAGPLLLAAALPDVSRPALIASVGLTALTCYLAVHFIATAVIDQLRPVAAAPVPARTPAPRQAAAAVSTLNAAGRPAGSNIGEIE